MKVFKVHTLHEVHFFPRQEYRGFILHEGGPLAMYRLDDVGMETVTVEPLLGGPIVETGHGMVVKRDAIPIISFNTDYWLSIEVIDIDTSEDIERLKGRKWGMLEDTDTNKAIDQ